MSDETVVKYAWMLTFVYGEVKFYKKYQEYTEDVYSYTEDVYSYTQDVYSYTNKYTLCFNHKNGRLWWQLFVVYHK